LRLPVAMRREIETWGAEQDPPLNVLGGGSADIGFLA